MEQAIGNLTAALAGVSVVQTIATSLIDQTLGMGTGIIGAELAARLNNLRGNRDLRRQVKTALERTAERWVLDHPDRDLVLTVAHSTTLITPSVETAISQLTTHPFDNGAVQTLTARWHEVLPSSFDVLAVSMLAWWHWWMCCARSLRVCLSCNRPWQCGQR